MVAYTARCMVHGAWCMAAYTARCLLHMFQPPFFSPINAQAMLLGILVHTAAGRDRAALCPLGWLFSLVGAQLCFLGPTTHPRAPPLPRRPQGDAEAGAGGAADPFSLFLAEQSSTKQAAPGGAAGDGHGAALGIPVPCHRLTCSPAGRPRPPSRRPGSCHPAARTHGGLSTTQPPRGPPSRVPKCHPPELGASVPPPGDRC